VEDHIMKQALLIVDEQTSFPISMEILHVNIELIGIHPIVHTVERHDESVTPFEGQLGWKPGKADESLIPANCVFIKHGYLPPPAAIEYLRGLRMDRILVCGAQADTCVLAAGFALFDAGLHPTLLKWLTVGSSLDRAGNLGARLWEHHFGSVLGHSDQLGLPEFSQRRVSSISKEGVRVTLKKGRKIPRMRYDSELEA
jgi:nicotinamidase-related amidase